MGKAEYYYQPSNLDDELFLCDIPLDILKSSIKYQFQYPLEYRKKDYIQSFITKYEFSIESMDEDDMFSLEMYHDEFMGFMLKTFDEYLNVGFVDFDNKSEEDQHDLIHLTYRFFIKNIKKNFVNVILNYIDENKNELNDSLERKKDVTSLSFKTEIEDEYDILVLANLADIINKALDDIRSAYDVDQFFKLCATDEPILELDYVSSRYENAEITGNFLEKYVDMVDSEFRFEIQSKVRNKILKKYPKRILNQNIKEIEELDSNENDVDETDNEE